MLGVSRRSYAKMWGVDEAAIRKAIRRGEEHLHPDGSVNVEASDEDWGHWHEFRTTPVELDPAWCQRIDAELEELASWTREALKTFTPT